MVIKKVDLMEDICTLTTLPKQTLLKIEKKKEQCIAHSVLEHHLDSEDTTCISLGFGDLYVGVDGDSIEYRFVPSQSLEKMLISAINTGESPLTTELDEVLLKKITQAYKDLF